MKKIEKQVNDIQSFAMDELKYFGRRIETVSLIICGFGLHGNFELIKFFKTENQYSNWFLMGSTILLLIAVFIFLNCLILERDVRAHYVHLFSEIKMDDVDSSKESLRLENKIILRSKISYFLMGLAFALSVISVFIFL